MTVGLLVSRMSYVGCTSTRGGCMPRHLSNDQTISIATRDSVADIWGERTPFLGEGEWTVRVDAALTEEPEHWVQSACLLCSNGCGLDIGVKEGRIVGVRGREVDSV